LITITITYKSQNYRLHTNKPGDDVFT